MARYLLLSLTFVLMSFWGMAQTSVGGKVTDVDNGEELIGANVIIYKNDVYVTGTSTDFDGNFKTNVDPGTYDVEVSYIGYPPNRITGVIVKAGQNNKLDVQLGGGGSGGIDLTTVVVTSYKVPLIEQDNTTSGGVITGEQIRNLPTKDITALAANTAGLSQADEGDNISVRGSRADGTDYYIDGIRVSGSGSLIPQSEIDQLQVITGGIEAQYGDVVGGIISITTKGPSNRYTGALEAETSEYLDDFGYNLLSANLSGPILKKKSGESILGFRVSAQYRRLKDDDPPASDIFQVSDAALAELEANPVVAFGTSLVPAGHFLTNDDVNVLGFQPNEEEERLDLTAKIDARLSKAIDITLTGSYSNREDRFTPREGQQTGNNWRVFNSHNNPYENDVRYRGNFRFRHRLGNVSDSEAASGEENAKNSLFSNVEYTLQAGYEKRLYDRDDFRHGDNFFRYGHVGNFDYEWIPSFGVEQNPFRFVHTDYTQVFNGFTPSEFNPVLANYNNASDAGNDNSFVAFNGFFTAGVNEIWDNHVNVGQVYNLSQIVDEDLITVNVSSSFDLNPGGSDKGTHSIRFGIIFEQRFNRGYDLAPINLWRIARQQANVSIAGIDSMNMVGDTMLGGDTVGIFRPGLAPSVNDPGFARNIRASLGMREDQFVNVDGLNPDQLSLDLFTAQELNDQFALIDLNYYGFSYTGEKLGNDVTFDDFFRATDANGVRTFPVASVQPNYSAAYIQDKFSYKDIIFRLGLRVDRYDANTKVLKDPYSLYEVMSVEDFRNLVPGEAIPDGVGDDFKVYVTDPESDKVKAFRQGDQWYTSGGSPVNDGRLIFGGGVVTPKLYENQVNNIKDPDFDPNTSFEDYAPQVNWMPRLAFSFPISDAANFFAHYDILVQRPSALGINIDRATALDYFYWEESQAARTPNANLRPQRTIDYEVGFQQKLSQSSALKIAVYYKEMRDMIQRRNYLFIPTITTYETFGNIDFGTVKGFTFQYDLRRTGNVTFTANYTLQFADGTGSDANDRRGITNRGLIRTLFPLNFDERHRLVGTIDYRFASGSRYNGPTAFGKDILSEFGVNLQAIGVSGRPYTVRGQADILDANGTVGQINGARLPWNITMNLRVDKNFRLSKPDAKTKLGLNVYLRVQNLLDTRNITRVYPLTGSPDDDGFLNSEQGLQRLSEVSTTGNVQSFIDAYQWRVLNPNFFSLPRRIYLGAIFEF